MQFAFNLMFIGMVPQIYGVARKYFGRGGKTRIKYTLVPLVFAILRLARRMGELIRRVGRLDEFVIFSELADLFWSSPEQS